MTENRPVDTSDGNCPTALETCPTVRVSTTGSRVVFCEQGNTDGWIASDVALELREMR
jgi:hypothetical protein